MSIKKKSGKLSFVGVVSCVCDDKARLLPRLKEKEEIKTKLSSGNPALRCGATLFSALSLPNTPKQNKYRAHNKKKEEKGQSVATEYL